jgi:hypothetical protein
LSVALTVPFTVKTADRAPVALGVKVRLIVQELDAAIVPPLAQEPVPALAKLDEFVPVIVKKGVARICDDVPVLLTVTVRGPLVVLTT